MTTTATQDVFVRAGSIEEIEREGMKVVAAEGRTILVIHDEGRLYALDNRCPHMGFPLRRGAVRDGILTCHWHHAKFDLSGGCTLDPFADDVPAFRLETRAGDVYVDPHPIESDRRAHWEGKLREGLEGQLSLVLAKSIIGLQELDATNDILREAALFGVRNRAGGWSTGLSILTAMANVMPVLHEDDRPLAVFHGAVHVARSTANQPPNFDLAPLETELRDPARYIDWFRRFVETRSTQAAERTLQSAIHLKLPPAAISEMVFAASTDHLFLDTGHTLDFANKAFELLDHIGWEHAGAVLPSIVPGLTGARRMEESASWRHPVDLASLLEGVHARLDEAIAEGGGRQRDWRGHRDLAEQILDGEPDETLDRMLTLLREGVPLEELSAAVAYAAARRAVHFHTSNEFGDWDTVHHSFTYANAVDQAMRRAPSNLLARGIFDGAMSVYLERFLNVPRQPHPAPSGDPILPDALLPAFDVQGQVDETARILADLVASDWREQAVEVLGQALLREDSGFHEFQIYEAGVRQYQHFAGRPEGDHILTGVARFLTAHSPTVRSRLQTFDIAARLHRGESLHGDE